MKLLAMGSNAKGARNEGGHCKDVMLDAALRRGIAFMTDGALISLIANRHAEEPEVVEAAIRELEDRYRKTRKNRSAEEG
jgi:hypothetical protein